MRKNRALFASRPPRRTGWLVFPLLLCCILGVTIALNMINNGRIKLIQQDVTIPSLSADLEKFRILHISDLHGLEFGANQSTLQTVLKDAKYNAVCITGDVCASDGSYDAFIKLIDLFEGKVPVYFVAGDEDPQPVSAENASVKADYVLAAEARGAIYLDAPMPIQIGKSTLWFCPESVYGLDIPASREAYLGRRAALVAGMNAANPALSSQLQMIDYRLETLDRIESGMNAMRGGDVQIALTHHPLTNDTINTLQQWSGDSRENFLHGVSLVLAGHYNAGQLRLPGLGALKAPASAGFPGNGWLPGDRGVVGLATVQGVTQYISPGLGASNVYLLPIRLFNTPAVSILTLTAVLSFH